MKLQLTRWRPDTCGCVVEYEWDADVDPEQRQHKFRSIEPCAAHGASLDTRIGKSHAVEERYADALENNQRKNGAVAEVLKASQALVPDDVRWSFDESRVLRLEVAAAKITAPDQRTVEKGLADGFKDVLLIVSRED